MGLCVWSCDSCELVVFVVMCVECWCCAVMCLLLHAAVTMIMCEIACVLHVVVCGMCSMLVVFIIICLFVLGCVVMC